MATRLAEVFLALLVVSITKYVPTSYFKIETKLRRKKKWIVCCSWFKLLHVVGGDN